MAISSNKIIHFSLTKIFKKEVNNFSDKNDKLKLKIDTCIKDFQESKFESIFYRKAIKNWKYKN